MGVKREVPVEQAIGMVLAHDLTKIVPGEFKGRVFAKGHVIREEDIPVLLDIGKRHIYVLELGPDEMHENDAAQTMARAVAGEGIAFSEVHEGKVVMKARWRGVLRVDEERVFAVNRIDGISLTTRTNWVHVDEGTSVAAVRPIPLVIEREKVERVVSIAGDEPLIQVLPYRMDRAALVTTGSEIQTGRIEDRAGPVLREKLRTYGVEVVSQVFPGDDQAAITAAIRDALAAGVPLVLVTGGMSVDPDDRSPAAIRAAADEVVTYGTPMLPGSMLMLAYARATAAGPDGISPAAIFGLPGAVIYDPRTSFDVLLPRVLAGVRLTKDDIARHGVGGWLNA
ncbi:molybdopterin-binding protein [Alicyclobacillus sp.]|uniref:molybdopterin-binding protein n=1 Tax=Alicyclobacillus sp. TaxID=61169 RepID=UPI0025BC5581|nr:molybdopterin-binding protein [Alicyclobacillus sp.]MCL6517913.1 molybdopterin-binding protein [Alicyclobacillus sp.]